MYTQTVLHSLTQFYTVLQWFIVLHTLTQSFSIFQCHTECKTVLHSLTQFFTILTKIPKKRQICEVFTKQSTQYNSVQFLSMQCIDARLSS